MFAIRSLPCLLAGLSFKKLSGGSSFSGTDHLFKFFEVGKGEVKCFLSFLGLDCIQLKIVHMSK